jgi:F-type H+-transporting ATPase subunit b
MSIDWITVGAQIVNFMVLVWLLKRFLYRPILDGIDAREAAIAARMAEATEVCQTAEATEARYKAEIATLRADRAGMLDEARRAAETERDALLAEARDRLTREQAERDDQRATEARQFTAGLHRDGAAALLALTRKALADLADETLEQRIVAHAAGHVGDLADGLRDAAGDDRQAVALTRDPLPEAMQAQLRDQLAAVLPGYALRFDTNADMSPGVSLRLGGAQVAWTLDSYLDGLDAALDDLAGRPLGKRSPDAL